MAAFSDPIPFLWQQRDVLRPFLASYGARILGKALARHYGLQDSRTACHQLAAFIMALTDFRECYDYGDFYISLDADDPVLPECLKELERLQLSYTPHGR